MKKRILALSTVLALVSLIAAPMAVLAVTGGTVISGTIANTADLTVPTNISFGTFAIDNNTGSATAGSVVANAAGWTLTVADIKTTNTDYMTKNGSSDTVKLAQPLLVGTTVNNCGTIAAYQALLLAEGTYGDAGTFSIPLYVSQVVGTGDAAGAYSITLTYTVTPAA